MKDEICGMTKSDFEAVRKLLKQPKYDWNRILFNLEPLSFYILGIVSVPIGFFMAKWIN